MAWDPESVIDALDAEAHHSPTPSARAHATLLAADVLRINELGDAAVDSWESACKLDPADPRAPIARAALALAQDDHTSERCVSPATRSHSLDRAVATALRLRGIERAEAEVDEMPINDGLRHARIALSNGDVVAASQAIIGIAAVPEMAKAALWLSSALGASHIAARRSAARSLKTLAAEGEFLARRQLAARGVGTLEIRSSSRPPSAVRPMRPTPRRTRSSRCGGTGNPPILAGKGDITDGLSPSGLSGPGAFSLGTDQTLAPLEDALLSLAPITASDGDSDREDEAVKRAGLTAGRPENRMLATVGRLLASNAPTHTVDEVLDGIEGRTASVSGVAIESAVRAAR